MGSSMRAWTRSLVLLLGLALSAPAQAGHQGSAAGGARAGAQRLKVKQQRQKRKSEAARQLADLRETTYISRDIASHETFLGPSFFRSLRGLGKGDHWIEIGPSSDARLALGYLFDTPEAQPYGFPRDKARVTGVGLEELHPHLAGQLDHAMKVRGVRYEHKSGRYLENYKRGEIERGNVVNDQFGAFSYTHRPQRILEIEGELLVEGGMLHTHSSPFTRVVDKHGNDVFVEWLKATQGLELVEHGKVDSGNLSWHQVALRRTGGSVRAPALRMTHFEMGHPPVREFVWDGRPARAERTPATRRTKVRAKDARTREAPGAAAAP